MGESGYRTLVTLFIHVLEDFVFHEDVAVQRRPVRHVNFLFPFLIRDCRSLQSLRLFEHTRNIELERQTVGMTRLPVIHVSHVIRLPQVQGGVELLEGFEQPLGLAQIDHLHFIVLGDVIAVHFLSLLLASVGFPLHLQAWNHHACVEHSHWHRQFVQLDLHPLHPAGLLHEDEWEEDCLPVVRVHVQADVRDVVE